jgi:hypothetical protein
MQPRFLPRLGAALDRIHRAFWLANATVDALVWVTIMHEASILRATMKHSLNLSRHRRANVWLDEAPPAAYTASSVVTKVVTPNVAIDPARRIAGVEFMFPRGPMPADALLGAELVEANVDGLEVIVSVNEVGVPFPASVAVKSDEVKIGLLSEYADAVISGIAKVAETIGAPKRRSLRFGRAAHGLVGSSPRVFEEVSGIVLQMFILPDASLDNGIRMLFD